MINKHVKMFSLTCNQGSWNEEKDQTQLFITNQATKPVSTHQEEKDNRHEGSMWWEKSAQGHS
jgi:hypothetical protein